MRREKVSDGGCLCAKVRYSVSERPQISAICHCVSCRRASGAQSVAWLTFAIEGFSFVTGDPARYRSSAKVSRTFCGQCGTTLTYQHDDELDFIDVTAASLDDPEEFPPTHHVWMEDAISWDTANDGLPRSDRPGAPMR
jgi:hypothetical protein